MSKNIQKQSNNNKSTDNEINEKVKSCLNYLKSGTKNKLLNSFLKEDIIEYEKSGKKFNNPLDFYQTNDSLKVFYDQYLLSKNINIVKQNKNTTNIVCPNCKSSDITIQYKQFLSGDEVETQIINCNYCGGSYTNL